MGEMVNVPTKAAVRLLLHIGFVALCLLVASTAHAEPSAQTLKPGDEFQDCDVCPVMVVVPPGKFMMGAPDHEPDTYAYAKPSHEVTIGYAFAMAKYELTVEQYAACVEDGGCRNTLTFGVSFCSGDDCVDARPIPRDAYWPGQPHRMKRRDADAYVAWLAAKTGRKYRLPSESEWEYSARGGTQTRYWWGDEMIMNMVNCKDCLDAATARQLRRDRKLIPIGSLAANPFGLHEVMGNLWEYVAGCYQFGFEGAPADGSPAADIECDAFVVKGGGHPNRRYDLHMFWRGKSVKNNLAGLRVAAELEESDGNETPPVKETHNID